MSSNSNPVDKGATKKDFVENSPGLSRLFSTVKERFSPVKTNMTGTIPAWLNGDLVRTGPGMFEINGHKYNHSFDGMAILHRFSIRNSEVTYQSKYLRGNTFTKNMKEQRIAMTEFGTVKTPDPCATLYSRFSAVFQPMQYGDNCNVNVIPFQNDEVFVATEAPHLRRFDIKTLDTQEKVDLTKIIAVNTATAHPHFEQDGTMYNIGSSFKEGPQYHVIKVPPSDKNENGTSCSFDKAHVLATIRGQFKICPCYYHSFAMTKNYIVLMEQPMFINVMKLMFRRLTNSAAVDSFEFSKQYHTKIHVIRKDTGEVLLQNFTSGPQCVFHHINAYEEDGQIVMDVVDSVENYLNTASMENLRKSDFTISQGEPRRFVLPLTLPPGKTVGDNLVTVDTSATAVLQNDGSIHCHSELLCAPGFDLPTINYKKCNGEKYKYFYATGVVIKGDYENSVLKCDVSNKTVKKWTASRTSYVSEPIFVPSPDAVDEDDGVVLCGVSDVSPSTPDYLVVLDGKTFREIARASIPDDTRLPYGLHGQFV